MKTLFTLMISLSFILNQNIHVQTNDADELETLLHWFLEGASDYETHKRFWADDLIYTSAAGERFGKNEILSGLRQNHQNNDNGSAFYRGENIQIRLFGDIAIVAFRLIAEFPGETTSEPAEFMSFYNTGTFIRSDGEWRAAAWQATRIP